MLRSRLALRLGRSLEELSQTVSAAEIRHWELFSVLEPIGDDRLDKLVAMLCRTVAVAGLKEWPGDDAYEIEWGKGLLDLSPQLRAEEEERTKRAFRAMLASKRAR